MPLTPIGWIHNQGIMSNIPSFYVSLDSGSGLAGISFRDQYVEWVGEGLAGRAWPICRYSPLDPGKVTTRFEWAIGGDAAAAISMAYAAQEMFQ